jgi:uncharacterized small protein (DUF1192 family)
MSAWEASVPNARMLLAAASNETLLRLRAYWVAEASVVVAALRDELAAVEQQLAAQRAEVARLVAKEKTR